MYDVYGGTREKSHAGKKFGCSHQIHIAPREDDTNVLVPELLFLFQDCGKCDGRGWLNDYF
jgi:hypothetical protein